MSRGYNIISLTPERRSSDFADIRPCGAIQRHLNHIGMFYLNADISNLLIYLPALIAAKKELLINQAILMQEVDRDKVIKFLHHYAISYRYIHDDAGIDNFYDQKKVVILDCTVFDKSKGEKAVEDRYSHRNISVVRADWCRFQKSRNTECSVYTAYAGLECLDSLLHEEDCASPAPGSGYCNPVSPSPLLRLKDKSILQSEEQRNMDNKENNPRVIHCYIPQEKFVQLLAKHKERIKQDLKESSIGRLNLEEQHPPSGEGKADDVDLCLFMNFLHYHKTSNVETCRRFFEEIKVHDSLLDREWQTTATNQQIKVLEDAADKCSDIWRFWIFIHTFNDRIFQSHYDLTSFTQQIEQDLRLILEECKKKLGDRGIWQCVKLVFNKIISLITYNIPGFKHREHFFSTPEEVKMRSIHKEIDKTLLELRKAPCL